MSDALGSAAVTWRRVDPRSFGLGLAAALLLLGGAALPPAGRLAATARAAQAAKPNDRLFKYQWNLQAIQVPDAWAVSRGEGAVVAVLDRLPTPRRGA